MTQFLYLSLMNFYQSLKSRLTSLEMLALVIAGCGAIALTYVCIIFFFNTDPILTPQGFNNDINIGITSALGSLISGLGALFTLASVIYFVAALKISQRDLKETTKTQNLHQFENTFFKLIDLHNTIIDNLVYEQLSGRNVFSTAVSSLKGATQFYWAEHPDGYIIQLDHDEAPQPSNIRKAKRKLMEDYYPFHYKNFEFTLNHYFRALYHVFKYLYKADLTTEQRETYAAIARSKLSQDELHLIMFNSLHPKYGYPNMLYLIKEFDILDNFNYHLVHPKVYYDLFLNEVRKVTNPF